MRVKLSQTYQKMLISNSINEKKRVFLESNAHWSRSYSKLKLISGKQHKTNAHLSCRPDITEKTVCSEIFRPEIDLNFLENVNALIGNRSPCYWSSIDNIQTLQGVSRENIYEKSRVEMRPRSYEHSPKKTYPTSQVERRPRSHGHYRTSSSNRPEKMIRLYFNYQFCSVHNCVDRFVSSPAVHIYDFQKIAVILSLE